LSQSCHIGEAKTVFHRISLAEPYRRGLDLAFVEPAHQCCAGEAYPLL